MQDDVNKIYQRLEKEKQLVKKGDPKWAGDHSPAIATINKATDNFLVVKRGKGEPKPHVKDIMRIGEHDIPTVQFRRLPELTTPITNRIPGLEIADGKKAHSILTSLRKNAGVGEQDKKDFNDILDMTLSSYWKTHFRVAAYSNISKNKTPIVLIDRPVHPFIAQAAINIWYRQTLSDRAIPQKLILSGRNEVAIPFNHSSRWPGVPQTPVIHGVLSALRGKSLDLPQATFAAIRRSPHQATDRIVGHLRQALRKRNHDELKDTAEWLVRWLSKERSALLSLAPVLPRLTIHFS
jgi:hypothetical protein